MPQVVYRRGIWGGLHATYPFYQAFLRDRARNANFINTLANNTNTAFNSMQPFNNPLPGPGGGGGGGGDFVGPQQGVGGDSGPPPGSSVANFQNLNTNLPPIPSGVGGQTAGETISQAVNAANSSRANRGFTPIPQRPSGSKVNPGGGGGTSNFSGSSVFR